MSQIHKHYWESPFYIFIKNGFKMSDQELFTQLGLNNCKLDKYIDREFPTKDRYCYLTEQDSWTHLMDDWSYSLWHHKTIRNNIEKLSQKFDIFYCSVGDIDESFDFVFYERGKLRRKYIVEDPKFNGGDLVENIGTPFPGEEVVLKIKDDIERVLKIARLVGVRIEHKQDKIRCYRYGNKSPDEYYFDENEH